MCIEDGEKDMGLGDIVEVSLCYPEDAPRLAPLIAALAVEEGAEPASISAIEQVVSALLQSGTSDFLIAVLGEQPIGCMQIMYRISTWHAARAAYFEDIYLVPEMRARGVGTKMLASAFLHLQEQGLTAVGLDVRRENRAAQRLYERFGFHDSGSTLFTCATHNMTSSADSGRIYQERENSGSK